MSYKYESSLELAQKANSEGDLSDLIFGYGLNHDGLPDDLPVDIRIALERLITAKYYMDKVQGYLSDIMDRAVWDDRNDEWVLPQEGSER